VITIVITPKLGPYGSAPDFVGVDVYIDLEGVKEQDWNTINGLLNKTFTIKVPSKGKPFLDTSSSKK